MPSNLHVWYLEAGELDGREFIVQKAGSAVLLAVKQPDGKTAKMLVTAQHLLRSAADGRSGPYFDRFRAWPPDSGYHPSAAVEVSRVPELCPTDDKMMLDHEDFAFLLLEDEAGGARTCPLLDDSACEDGLDNLTLAGFPGGHSYIALHSYRVRAAEFRRWRWQGVLEPSSIAILTGGEGPPVEGVSGGGAFHAGRYAGVYRGEFAGIKQHILLPVSRLREWCADKGYKLSSHTPQDPGADGRLLILHVDHDRGLAEGLKELLDPLITPLQAILLRPAQCEGVRPKDYLIALLTPSSLVDGQFRFVIGSSAGKRTGRDAVEVDAVVFGKGCGDHAKDLEKSYVRVALEKGALGALIGEIHKWLKSSGYPVQQSPDLPSRIETFVKSIPDRIDWELNESTRVLYDFSVGLRKIHQSHRAATPYIFITASDLAAGMVRIVEPRRIYDHDRQALKLLQPGDYYFATHPVDQNTEARQGSKSYDAYINAHIDAAARGVRVVRLYLLPSLADIYIQSSWSLREEIHHLAENGVEIYVGDESQGLIDKEFPKDFVLISDKCLGCGMPKDGPMGWSDYRIASTPQGQAMIRDYTDYFERLRNHSSVHRYQSATSDFSPQGLARRPASVELTGVTIGGQPAQRMMVVLRTNGCRYDQGTSGCTMCDFKRHAIPKKVTPIESGHLIAQLMSAFANTPGAGDARQLDLLVLGSLFDDKEIPPQFWKMVGSFLKGKSIQRLLVESRAQYIKGPRLEELREAIPPEVLIEVGIGVETANHFLRNNVLSKSLPWPILKTAVKCLAEHDLGFVCYLLVKPQTLNDKEALTDAVASAKEVAKLCGSVGLPPGRLRIAFEPVFITQGTALEDMFLRDRYTLVFLSTVVEVVRQTRRTLDPRTDIFVGLSDEGLSGNRKPRGCDEACTVRLTEALQRFNSSNDISVLDDVDCPDCKLKYK